MAYDKIIPIKGRLDHCVNYVLNPQKADLGRVLDYIGNTDKTITPDGSAILETAINCQLETAYQEMLATKRRWNKKGGVLGYHLIHSYAPGEVTPEQAHALGVEFARQLLGDRYEVVISTHLDHGHLHNHVLFNSVSCIDGKKYRDNFKAYFGDIRGTSNAVSHRHGLSVIKPENKGKSYAEWDAHRKGKATVRNLIRQDIDAIIGQSFTYATFLAALRKNGYEIKAGPNVKHTAVKAPGGSRFIRLDSLGDGYSEDAIKHRLSATRSSPTPALPQQSIPPSRRKYFIRQKRPFKWKRKPRGFRALYVYYLYLLGNRKPKLKQKYIPLAVRQEVTRLHRYQSQYRLLREYRIDTDDELAMLSGAFQSDIDALVEQRKRLYKEQRRGGDVSSEINTINTKLRQIRKNLKICGSIQADIPQIREHVQIVQQLERKEQQNETAKQHKIERRFDPWM
mgnify:FL=1